MSSKAEQRRRSYRQRQAKKARRKSPWTCQGCGETVPAWSPICLCGCIRGDA